MTMASHRIKGYSRLDIILKYLTWFYYIANYKPDFFCRTYLQFSGKFNIDYNLCTTFYKSKVNRVLSFRLWHSIINKAWQALKRPGRLFKPLGNVIQKMLIQTLNSSLRILHRSATCSLWILDMSEGWKTSIFKHFSKILFVTLQRILL